MMSDEEENEQKIEKYRSILDLNEKRPFLEAIEKLYIMKSLCDLKDEKACQILDEVVPELRRQAENEDNMVLKDMLKKVGLWK